MTFYTRLHTRDYHNTLKELVELIVYATVPNEQRFHQHMLDINPHHDARDERGRYAKVPPTQEG